MGIEECSFFLLGSVSGNGLNQGSGKAGSSLYCALGLDLCRRELWVEIGIELMSRSSLAGYF